MTNDRVVVVHYEMDPGGSHGRWVAISDGGFNMQLPAGVTWNPVQLVDWFAPHFDQEGTIVVPEAWGDPAWIKATQEAGWLVHTGAAGEVDPNNTPWTTLRQVGQPVIHLCRMDLAAGDTRTPLLPQGVLPHQAMHYLSTWHNVTRSAYRGSPGTTGTHLLRAIVRSKGKGGILWLGSPIQDADQNLVRGMGDLVWSRTPDDREHDRPYVHGYDLVAQYMAACGTATLPYADLSYREPPAYDPALGAGYWRVRADTVRHHFGSGRQPGIIDSRRINGDGETIWLTSPIMEYLDKTHGLHPEVIGAYLPMPRMDDKTRRLLPPAGRILQRWSEIMFSYRAAFDWDAVLMGVAKRAPNETIGLMGRVGGRCYRPDWRWLIIDTARANLFRKIDRATTDATVSVLGIKTDAMWFASAEPDPVKLAEEIGLRIGTTMGCVRTIGTVRTEQWTGKLP